jgi:uncharacterized repeat protein (TIGR01451 family)
MNSAIRNRSAQAWRMTIILLGVLVLCSCRNTSTNNPPAPFGRGAGGEGPARATMMHQPSSPAETPQSGPATTVPPQAATMQPRYDAPSAGGVVPTAYLESQPQPPAQNYPVMPIDGPCIMGMTGIEGAAPLPYTAAGPWIPPGIVPPWPTDEYLCDGGQVGPPVAVGKNGALLGLQMEDTVARYTTLDGRTLIEPSNKVELYSPRFNAVRQVVDVEVDQQRHRAAGVAEPVKVVAPRTSEPVAFNARNERLVREIGTNPAGQLRARLTHAALSTNLLPRAFDNHFRAFEDFAVIRSGIYIGSDEPILARASQAAIAWKKNQGVQVILDEQTAAAAVASQKPQETFTIGSAPNPRLRIVKVASTPVAEPGDEVSFTIRFDNVGNQPIGSVQIIDSLTTRLEYVPDSAQCSLKARFTTQPNEGDSLVVRCVLDEPLPAGKGGIFRFRCIVR